ncbi:20810_t:CDS:2, partial [Entrophospora sp. SA101]
MARTLGTQYLDKLERVVDYRSTFRVLELIWAAVGIAIHLYKKQNNLMTKKYKYAESVTRFLIHVSRNPLQKQLQAAPSVNLTKENHYLAYNETLEIFGIKFVKQNLPGNVKSSEDLKNLIKTVQVERERMLMLYDEFVDESNVPRKERNVNEHRQAMWGLADELLKTFESNLPERSILLKETTQLTKEGYQRLQDIDLTEPRNTVGRGKGYLEQLRVKDIEELTNINYVEENEEIEMQIEVPIIETDTPLILEEEIIPMEIDETNVTKKSRHKPTTQEQEHLSILEQYKDFLPAE